ncbi:MAG: 50S ribosomal protein L19 [Candidatus Omnitrophota bacterium]
MDKIKAIEAKYIKKRAEFAVGDTVKVYIRIIEEGKQRLQAFEGMVIGKKGSGVNKSFIVRRVSYGEGVERTFPLNATTLERIEVVRRGQVRRAKLYYLRKKIGKKTTVKEKIGPLSQKKREESPKA